MASKINWLVSHTLPGALVLQQWLVKNGISHSLTQKYARSGWLNKLFTGVYYRPVADQNYQPGWADAVQALRQQLSLPVHLAGLSSLSHQGLSHYLPLGSARVWLGMAGRQPLPGWFKNFPGQSWLYCYGSKLGALSERDFTTVTLNGRELVASSAELAAYEVVDAIGRHIRFEHAAELFQGLVNLSPRKVQSLLSRSQAVQTNRVFLFLSHYHGHQWAKRLVESRINLGSGKRQVVRQGRYDERYKITVPRSLAVTGR